MQEIAKLFFTEGKTHFLYATIFFLFVVVEEKKCFYVQLKNPVTIISI